MGEGLFLSCGNEESMKEEGAIERLRRKDTIPALYNGDGPPETVFADIASAIRWCTGALQAPPADVHAEVVAFAKTTLPMLVEVLLRRKTLR